MHSCHGPDNLPRAFAGAAVLLLAAAGPAVAAGPGPPAAAGATVAAAPSSPAPADRTDPRTATATLDIPAIGVRDLRVVPYEGTTDDRPGTRVQDRGVAASPYGGRGGAGPGEKGNYLVTAHRIKAGGPLRDLPSLDEGDSVFVTADGTVHEYRITETRKTSFRSERSLAEQRADVPGSPGEKPKRPMITISTCATPEDDAAGNHWRDGNDNPEHRIDKIGVLVGSEPS
ncbi:class E sortase [Streptomyces sp. NBC_01754]|uniref:class E sortase n=1 Tax=Streptomyces sp. NBC_01754 TaxID=2975930 RepID=UPI002DDAED62|nr:class E sortase [Streptomyces sp. NBC_01754]WSC93421.1 class E sortase [Streptomyces sp. NBC_01754]